MGNYKPQGSSQVLEKGGFFNPITGALKVLFGTLALTATNITFHDDKLTNYQVPTGKKAKILGMSYNQVATGWQNFLNYAPAVDSNTDEVKLHHNLVLVVGTLKIPADSKIATVPADQYIGQRSTSASVNNTITELYIEELDA